MRSSGTTTPFDGAATIRGGISGRVFFGKSRYPTLHRIGLRPKGKVLTVEHMRLVLLVLVLGGCDLYYGGGDDAPIAPDAAVPMPDAAPACAISGQNTCAAAYYTAGVACDRQVKCINAETNWSACVEAYVASLCSTRDCTAAYDDWARLEKCGHDAARPTCDQTAIMCSL